MDFSLDDAQEEVQGLARKILEDLATQEHLREVEATDDVFDRSTWQEIAKANLLGVAIDEEHGGMGMGFFSLCLLLEEIGRAVAPLPVLPSLAWGALPIQRFGSDAQRQRWLPGVATGETILTGALQEPGSQDPMQPRTRASRDGDGWVLSGRKLSVPAAHLAQRIVLAATTSDAGCGLFLVDPTANGVTLTRHAVTDRQPHFDIDLDAVKVANDDTLDGALESGKDALAWWVEHAVTALCAVQVGVSERALGMTSEYAASRVQFDRPIGSFQAVHQRAADAYIQLQGMRLTTWDAATRLEAGEPSADAVAVAKYWASVGGQFVGYAAQHLHGGIGIDIDYPLHRYYLWAKQNELTLGAAPVQLAAIGARLAS